MTLQTLKITDEDVPPSQKQAVPKVYCVTYRQQFGSCFIYRNEIMMAISLVAINTIAKKLLQPGEIISHIKDI